MGRPATKPAALKDGFYIEVRNKGSKTGIKIRRDDKQGMLHSIEDYERSKDIIIYGELKNGKWVNKTPTPHEPKEK